MVATMRHLFAALLLLTAIGSAEAQTFGSSTIETTTVNLTAVSSVFTPPCPTLGGGFSTHNIVATAINQSIALPTCSASSVGLFVTFNICDGKNTTGTGPCNGTASGPFSPGLTFGAGFEFPGSVAYAVNATNGNNVSGAKDLVTCEVMGTSGPWSCGVPQYALGSTLAPVLVAQTNCAGTGSTGCTTAGINTSATATNGPANLYVVTISGPGSLPGASDLGGDTFTSAANTGSAGNGPFCTIYYVANPSVNVAETFSTSSVVTNLGAFAFKIPSPVLDQTNSSNSGAGSVATIQPGSITVPANELLVAMASVNGLDSATVNAPYVAGLQNYTGSSGNYYGALNAYFLPTTATSYNPTFTLGGGNQTASACSVSFQ